MYFIVRYILYNICQQIFIAVLRLRSRSRFSRLWSLVCKVDQIIFFRMHLRLFFRTQPLLNSKLHFQKVRYQTTAITSQMENRDNMGTIIEGFESADVIPFARAKIGTFFQEVPVLGNPFKEDVHLQSYLRRVIPQNVRLHNFAKVQ